MAKVMSDKEIAALLVIDPYNVIHLLHGEPPWFDSESARTLS
jgi:hypothetical protein